MNMMAPMTSSSVLAARAMVVSLSISQWSGRRLDRQVTHEVNTSHNAESDASRVNKMLLPKEALADIAKIANETRDEFAKRTLPWLDNGGGRIMAADAYLAYVQWFNSQKRKFDKAVAEFCRDYPGYVAAARNRLGTMFKDEDYPSIDDIERKFAMAVKVMPVPTASDFRVDMADSQAAQIRSDIERDVHEAMTNAVADCFRRISEVVGRMVERLEAYKPATKPGQKTEGVFRDSLVENVRDLVDIMPALNIVGDVRLIAITDQMRELTRFSAETLRISPNARRDTAAKAKAIFDQVSDFI